MIIKYKLLCLPWVVQKMATLKESGDSVKAFILHCHSGLRPRILGQMPSYQECVCGQSTFVNSGVWRMLTAESARTTRFCTAGNSTWADSSLETISFERQTGPDPAPSRQSVLRARCPTGFVPSDRDQRIVSPPKTLR